MTMSEYVYKPSRFYIHSGIESHYRTIILEPIANLANKIRSNQDMRKCSAADNEHLAVVIFIPLLGSFLQLKVLFGTDPRPYLRRPLLPIVKQKGRAVTRPASVVGLCSNLQSIFRKRNVLQPGRVGQWFRPEEPALLELRHSLCWGQV